MKFTIPKEFMGVSADEAIRAVESNVNKPASKKGKPSNVTPLPVNITNPEHYIILDGRKHGSYIYPDILVATEKSYFGKDWNQSQDALHKNGDFMLTIRQFADFLSLLKSGKAYDGRGKKVDGRRLTSVLNEIVKVKDPWRSEWLDAKFGNGEISYNVIDTKGLREVSEPLVDYFTEDKQISLADWLKNANYQGLPKSNVKSGSLYFYTPVNGSVAGFVANSDGAGLLCNRDPTSANSSLGVNVARKKI